MTEVEQPKKRRFLTFTRKVMLLLLLIAGFAIYTRLSVTHHSNSQHISDEVFEVRLHNIENSIPPFEKHLEEIDEKVAKLSAASPAAQPNQEARIVALEKEIAALKANPVTVAPGTGKTVISTQGNEELFQAIHLLSGFYRLSNKVMAGKSYAQELSAFEEMAPDETKSDPVTILAPYADSGIPTFAILLAAFDDSLEQLNAAQSVPPSDASWWDKFVFNLHHLINIRKVDTSGNEKTTDAIISRAQAHLEHQEIEAAQTEIKSLPEDIRSNFSTWLEESQIYVETPSLMDQLEEQVLQTAFHTETRLEAPKGSKQ